MGLIQNHRAQQTQHRTIRRLVRERTPPPPKHSTPRPPNPPQEHAPEVLVLPGIPSATRYKALNPHTASPNLITYDFPDLSYTTNPQFQAVANQEPPQALVDRIYAHAAFDIRFYAEFALPALSPFSPVPSPSQAPAAPAPLLASVTFAPLAGREGDFAIWFAGKFVLQLKGLKGYVGARRFEFSSGVCREGNVVSAPGRPRFLALVEFEGEGEGEVRGLEEVVGGNALAEVVVEWFGVKKVWGLGDVLERGEAP